MSRRLISVIAACMLCLTSHAKWPLPYDAEVEWLLGDGASSISTGINADISKDVVRCGAIEPVGGLNGTIFCYKSGINPVNKLHFYDSSSGTHSVRIVFGSYGSTGFNSNYGFAAFGERIEAVINHTSLTVSFTRTSDGYSISGNITVRPYTWEEYVLFQNTRAEVCSFSVERSGDIIIDLIPVRFTNEDGVSEGAMYDRVSGQLFRNQGTGAFIIGPDKTTAEPIVRTGKFDRIYSARDYVQDGLVAMWDGIENAGWGVHDSDAATWKDLVGMRNFVLTDTTDAHFERNCFVTDSQYQTAATMSDPIPNAQAMTTEYIFQTISRAGALRDYILCIGTTHRGGAYDMYNRILSYQINGSSRTGWLLAGAYLQGMIKLANNTPMPIGTFSFSTTYLTEGGIDKHYENGTLKSIATSNDGAAGKSPAFIGGDSSANGIYARIYAVRTYDRQLTASEIAHNYEIDKIRFNLP